MKRAYSPFDVAVYFKTENLPISEENRILESLWEYRDALLAARYRKAKRLFSNSVRNALHKLDGIKEGVDEANIILAEMGSKYQVFEAEYEQDVMESYFKVMKLRLAYTPGKDYCRLKLRTLIRCFGYKRRSAVLVVTIKKTMKSLGLQPYLSGWEYCDIGEVMLDTMMIVRLK